MKNYKEILEHLRQKISNGSWLEMTKEEIEELERLFDLEYEKDKNKERGAGDDYPVIEPQNWK